MIHNQEAIDDFLDGVITKQEFVNITEATDKEIEKIHGNLFIGIHPAAMSFSCD